MSDLKKKYEAFVARLSEDEVRSELVSCYLQMDRCQDILRGEDVEPVEMMDNGESTDLELFYRCKKLREECDYLNSIVSCGRDDDGEGE